MSINELHVTSICNDLLFSWDDFNALDESKQFAYFKGSLETMHAQPCNRNIQHKILQQINFKAGDEVLEVGCGLGMRAKLIAHSANNQVNVTAIDKSENVLAVAKNIAHAPNITYQSADALHLPFPNACFDVVTAERFLIGFADPIPVLTEMYRVLKPGGTLAITDFDPASVVIAPLPATMHKTFMDIYMPSFCDQFVGRNIPSFFKQIGIRDFNVAVDISSETNLTILEKIIPMQQVFDGGVRAGYLTEADAKQCLADLRRASDDGVFLYTINVISAVGKKTCVKLDLR